MTTLVNATTPRKTISSYVEQRPKGPAFGPQGPRVPDIDRLVSTAYSPQLAYITSVISTWAYADERALAEKLRYYGIEAARIRRISVQNDALLVVATAYFIQSATGKSGILAFRGTDPASFITILADGETMLRPFLGGGAVHSGFYTNVEAVWDDVIASLDAALRGEYLEERGGRTVAVPFAPAQPLQALYITGHSLGGAMAVLAAARLCQGNAGAWNPNDGKLKGVYTFGQPMVGNEAFARSSDTAFGSRLFRHVYRNDVVPHLPPKSALDYRHIGTKERHAARLSAPWTTRPASKRVSLTRALAEVGFDAIEARLQPTGAPEGLSIDDHMPSSYLDVSRYTIDPASGYTVAPPRPWIGALVPSPLRGAFKSLRARSDGDIL